MAVPGGLILKGVGQHTGARGLGLVRSGPAYFNGRAQSRPPRAHAGPSGPGSRLVRSGQGLADPGRLLREYDLEKLRLYCMCHSRVHQCDLAPGPIFTDLSHSFSL